MNLPNLLASLRMVLAPLLFFLMSHKFSGVHPSWMDYFAALAFGLAAMTDFFDGFIARAWGQKTKLGAIIDPLADKMLILAAFLGLLVRDTALLQSGGEWLQGLQNGGFGGENLLQNGGLFQNSGELFQSGGSALGGIFDAATLYNIELWAIYIILVREFFITGFRVILAAQGLEVAASFAGKLKTAFQIIAVIFLIMRWDFGCGADKILLLIALALTLYSGFEYILNYQRHIKRGFK